MTVEIVTFGCRLNAFESEAIRLRAAAAGLVDAVIVNTCAVTAEAERQARQAIRRARRDVRCAAHRHRLRGADRPGALCRAWTRSIWCWATARSCGGSYGHRARVAVADICAARRPRRRSSTGFDGRARAFVEVQQGCDHRCTFCIIP